MMSKKEFRHQWNQAHLVDDKTCVHPISPYPSIPFSEEDFDRAWDRYQKESSEVEARYKTFLKERQKRFRAHCT